MCERTCPKCGSNDHIGQYGLLGMTLVCTTCFAILANRYDAEAAPLDCADPDAYARARSGVRPGAEASDPAEDAIFEGTATFN